MVMRGVVDPGCRIGARGEDLQFDPVVDLGTDRAPPGVHLVGELDRVHVQAGAQDRRTRVNPQFERGDHTEEARSRAAGGPIQVGVVLGVAVDLFTVGGDDLEPKHALTCRAEHRTVPAVSALQQIAAEANAFAMARREEEPLRVEFGREDAGDLARPDVRGHPILCRPCSGRGG